MQTNSKTCDLRVYGIQRSDGRVLTRYDGWSDKLDDIHIWTTAKAARCQITWYHTYEPGHEYFLLEFFITLHCALPEKERVQKVTRRKKEVQCRAKIERLKLQEQAILRQLAATEAERLASGARSVF